MESHNNRAVNFSNATDAGSVDFKVEHTHAYITLLYLNCLTIVGITLNSFVFGIIVFVKNYRRPPNFILAFLAILYVTYFSIVMIREFTHSGTIPGEGDWIANHLTCTILLYLNRVSVTGISVTTVALSVERIHILRNPTKASWVSKEYKRNMILIMLYSFAMSIPILFTRTYADMDGIYQCIKILLAGNEVMSVLHCLWQFCVISFIPAVILFRETWITRFQIRYLLSREGMKVLTEDKLQKLFITSCVFTCIFVTCWLPFGFFLSFKDLPKEIVGNESIWRSIVNTGFVVARNVGHFCMCFNMGFLILMNYQWSRKQFLRSVFLST